MQLTDLKLQQAGPQLPAAELRLHRPQPQRRVAKLKLPMPELSKHQPRLHQARQPPKVPVTAWAARSAASTFGLQEA